MDTYVIDVEGGKSVLVVSPSGESLLFDLGWSGYNGRDSDRIVKAAHAPNALCSTITANPELPQDKEDGMSVGLLLATENSGCWTSPTSSGLTTTS
jgi:hypothetical protein